MNTNGAISFAKGLAGDFHPKPFPLVHKEEVDIPLIAPFWADIDTEDNYSKYGDRNNGTIYFRQTQDPQELKNVTDLAKNVFQSSGLNDFQASLLFVATWAKVTFYVENEAAKGDLPVRHNFTIKTFHRIYLLTLASSL